MKITPGKAKSVEEIKYWYSLDIGFSETKNSCGVYKSDSSGSKETSLLNYGAVAEDIIAFAEKNHHIGLIIEAPLSYKLNNKGNPVGRKIIEKSADGKQRYWYVGAGAAVMMAALLLLKKLLQKDSQAEIALYEGFVSFKDVSTNHERDAEDLYDQRKDARDYSEEGFVGVLGVADSYVESSGVPAIIEVKRKR